MSKEVIGIVGTIAAGKDTAGDHISDAFNIPSFQISSVLKEICAKNGVIPSRDNLIALGTQLAADHGDGYLAEYILKQMPQRAVITGMRQLGQIAVLEFSSNLTLLSIDAGSSIRFDRTRKNDMLGEAKSLEEFVAREIAENSAPNAQRLFEVMDLAKFHLTNENSVEDLYAQLDLILLNGKK